MRGALPGLFHAVSGYCARVQEVARDEQPLRHGGQGVHERAELPVGEVIAPEGGRGELRPIEAEVDTGQLLLAHLGLGRVAAQARGRHNARQQQVE